MAPGLLSTDPGDWTTVLVPAATAADAADAIILASTEEAARMPDITTIDPQAPLLLPVAALQVDILNPPLSGKIGRYLGDVRGTLRL